MKASDPQLDPLPGKQVVLSAVLEDFKDRAEAGKLRYGTYLETHNGRDALKDALDEAMDLVMYLKQMLMERDGE